MKHTDLRRKYREFESIERTELKMAVLAHGGEFRFCNSDGTPLESVEAPIILAGNRHWESNVDCIITRVTVVNDCLQIYGYDKATWISAESLLDDVAFGHMSYITDAIPETEEVQDVTIKSIII